MNVPYYVENEAIWRAADEFRASAEVVGNDIPPIDALYIVDVALQFDVIDILRTPYRIDIHQPLYYVLDDIDTLFAAAGCDLLADVRKAQSLGLFEPLYPEARAAS